MSILAALALSAIASSAAQAFEWEIEWQTLAERGLSSETTAGSGEAFEIAGNVAGENVTVSCSSETGSGSVAAGGTGKETLGLSGCAVVKPAACAMPSSLNLKTSTELIEVGGVVYEKFVPVAPATNFANLELEGCAAEGKYPIRGSFAGLGEQGKAQLVNQPLSFSAAIGSAAGTSLTVGTKSATIAGSAERHLSGANVGKWWRRWQGPVNNWLINGKVLAVGNSEITKISGGAFTFSSTFLDFNCSAVSGKESLITGGGTGSLKLQFTGCAQTKPEGCTMPSSFTTNQLKTTLKGIGGYMYQTFTPSSGSTLFSFVNSGCATEGLKAVTGSFSGKGGASGSEAVSQSFTFSNAIDTEAGSGMKVGLYGLTQSGSWSEELAGTNSGVKWGGIKN